jgi:trk system potassium uptake protein TrkH
VTGLAVISPARDLTMFGELLLMGMVQVGGVGFTVLVVLTLQALGVRVGMRGRIALRESLRLPTVERVGQMAVRLLVMTLVIEGVGAVALWLNWREQLGDARALYYGIFHAISAYCNAGLDLFGGLAEFPTGLPTDGITLTIMGTLIVLGGIGLPVFDELLRRDERLSLHARITLFSAVGLIVAGAVGFFVAETRAGGILANEPWNRQFAVSVFQSVAARTAGYAGISTFDQMTPASQLVLVVLMFIGCAPSSMGGGITTGTFAVLMVALVSYIRGLPNAQLAGRQIASETVRRASIILVSSLLLVNTATWLLLLTHDVSFGVALFEVVSAFATCGLTLAFTGQLTTFGQLVIIVMMFCGRVGALTLMVAFTEQSVRQRFTYPEESVLIG